MPGGSIAVGLALVLAGAPIGALELSLEEALSMARSASLRVRAAEASVAEAEGGVGLARADLLPRLGATANTSYYDGEVFYARFLNLLDPGSVDPDAPPTDVSGFSSSVGGGLTISQPLYAGGAILGQVRAREQEEKVASELLRTERIEVAYEVTRAYYDLLLSRRALEVAEASLGRSRATLDAVLTRRRAEEALPVEELAAKSGVAVDLQRMTRAENGAMVALQALNRLLGRDPGEPIELTDALDAPRRALDDATIARRADAESPKLRELAGRVALAEAGMAVARSHFKPKLRLEGFYTRIDNELFFEGDFVQASVQLSIPFLRDLKAGRSALGQATGRRDRAQSLLDEARSVVRLEATRASRRLADAYDAIDATLAVVDYQREKHRITEVAFGEGVVTVEDLNDEHGELADAELELLQAHHRARLLEAELDRLVGREAAAP